MPDDVPTPISPPPPPDSGEQQQAPAAVDSAQATSVTSGAAGPTPAAGPDRLKPAGIALGVASVALAAGIVTVNLSGAGSGSDDASGTTGPGGGAAPSSAPVAAASAGLIGSWTGAVSGDSEEFATRITIDSVDDGAPESTHAVSGTLFFADPQSGAWAQAGELTGTVAGTALQLDSPSRVTVNLTVVDDETTGTMTLPDVDDATTTAQLRLRRD